MIFGGNLYEFVENKPEHQQRQHTYRSYFEEGKHMISRRKFLGSAVWATIGIPTGAKRTFAQGTWPSREVHSISAFPPGAGADVFVRFYSKQLQDALGKTVIVENKVGAFGNIAAEYVTKAKP